jgi:flagellin-specific chaperone FliS
MPDFKGNIANYLLSTWEKLIPSLKETNKEKIPEIVNSLVELLKKPPEMSISSNPEIKIDVNEFFSDKKDKNDEPKNVELKTSETEEFTTFIETLNSFLNQCPELYSFEQVKNMYPLIHKLIEYPNNDIKSEISKVFSNCIEILVKINADKESILYPTAKQYISDIVTQLLKESDYSVIISHLDSMREIIKACKLFLTTNEINELSAKIFLLFNKIEEGRKKLLEEKEVATKDFEEEKKTGDNKINSDDEDDDQSQEELMEDINDKIDEVESVMTSISDFFGALFESHKQLTLELVDEIIKKYLPKYLLDTSSNFEKLLGLLLLGDMAEFLHQELLNNIWNDICTILIKYSPHANYEVRNAACYGLGVFAQ